MRERKSNEKYNDIINLPPKKGVVYSTSVSTTKKQGNTNNKENNIQITQPLEALTYPSKYMFDSQQSSNHRSRPNLHQINQNAHNIVSHPAANKKHQRQQQIFQRRLSLKCTKNLSEQLQSHLSHRLSVAQERQSLGSSKRLPQSLLEERYSMASSTVARKDSKREGMKKQAIITNFMNKLDQEEDLRSIIESKLNGCNSKARRNQSFLTEFHEDNSSKIKNCENEIKLFKSTIKEMYQKIVQMTNEEKNLKKRQSYTQHTQSNLNSLISQLSQECKCRTKKYNSIGIQTQPIQPAYHQSFDFLSNLEKTLKVLGNGH